MASWTTHKTDDSGRGIGPIHAMSRRSSQLPRSSGRAGEWRVIESHSGGDQAECSAMLCPGLGCRSRRVMCRLKVELVRAFSPTSLRLITR